MARCTWLVVGFVKSLKSSHKEAQTKPFSVRIICDLISPTSNQIPDIHTAVSVIYATLEYFPACVFILFNHPSFKLKLSVLL